MTTHFGDRAEFPCCSSEAAFSLYQKYSFEPIQCSLPNIGANMLRREFLDRHVSAMMEMPLWPLGIDIPLKGIP
jgi:hypothetical protein